MTETYPFKDAAAITLALDAVAARWPDLATRCAEIKAGRARDERS